MACNSIILAYGTTSEEACLNFFLNQTATKYVDNTTILNSTLLYNDISCLIYSNPGFYSDGTNVINWGINSITEEFEILSTTTCTTSNKIKNCCDITQIPLSADTFTWTNISSFYGSGQLPIGLALNILGYEDGTANQLNQCYVVVTGTSTSSYTATTVLSEEISCEDCFINNNINCYLQPGKYFFSKCNETGTTLVFTIENSKTFLNTDYIIYEGECYSPLSTASESETSLSSFSSPDGSNCESAPICLPTPTPTPTNVSKYVKDCCFNNIYMTTSEINRAVGFFLLDTVTKYCYTVVEAPNPLPPYVPVIDDTNFTAGTYSYSCLEPNPECIECGSAIQPTPTPSSSPIPVLQPNQCAVTTLLPLSVNCETTEIITQNDGTLSLTITGGTKPYVIFLNGTNVGTQTIFQNLSAGTYNIVVTDYYGDFTANTTCFITAPSPTPTPTLTPTPSATPAPVYNDICFQFTLNGIYYSLLFDYTSNLVWTSGTYVLSAKTNNSGYKIYNWNNGGSIETSSTNLPPISGWQILGVSNPPNIIVTEGSCPPAPPLLQTVTKTDNNCQGVLPCTGNITVSASGGIPPYSYSINNGLNYQGSPIFNGICPNTYNVITKDSVNTTSSVQTVVVNSLQSPTSYILSIVSNTSNVTIPIQFNPLGPTYNFQGKKIEFQIVPTPALPVGTTITFNLAISSSRKYSPKVSVPGRGTFVARRYSRNFVYSGASLLTPIVTKVDPDNGGSVSSRPGCVLNYLGDNVMEYVSDYSAVTYNNLVLSANQIISGYTLSTPIVTQGLNYNYPCQAYSEVIDEIYFSGPARISGPCTVTFADTGLNVSTEQIATGNNFPT